MISYNDNDAVTLSAAYSLYTHLTGEYIIVNNKPADPQTQQHRHMMSSMQFPEEEAYRQATIDAYRNSMPVKLKFRRLIFVLFFSAIIFIITMR